MYVSLLTAKFSYIKKNVAPHTPTGCMCQDGAIKQFKGARYLLIIHEVLVAMDFFPAGVKGPGGGVTKTS